VSIVTDVKTECGKAVDNLWIKTKKDDSHFLGVFYEIYRKFVKKVQNSYYHLFY